jgi:hypothetical protein
MLSKAGRFVEGLQVVGVLKLTDKYHFQVWLHVVYLYITSTYWKNFDVLFATLWTKLAILSKNKGNFKFFSPYCPITSLLRCTTNTCCYFDEGRKMSVLRQHWIFVSFARLVKYSSHLRRYGN